jgi:cysteinyl-tRNA synthetase
MDDDFNTALAVGQLFEAAKFINRYLDSHPQKTWHHDDLVAALSLFKELADILGILEAKPKDFLKNQGDEKDLPIPEEEIQELIAQRNQARKEKQWVTADEIRDRLASMNIILKDSPDGTQWQMKR